MTVGCHSCQWGHWHSERLHFYRLPVWLPGATGSGLSQGRHRDWQWPSELDSEPGPEYQSQKPPRSHPSEAGPATSPALAAPGPVSSVPSSGAPAPGRALAPGPSLSRSCQWLPQCSGRAPGPGPASFNMPGSESEPTSANDGPPTRSKSLALPVFQTRRPDASEKESCSQAETRDC